MGTAMHRTKCYQDLYQRPWCKEESALRAAPDSDATPATLILL